jgi:hypothetical protein
MLVNIQLLERMYYVCRSFEEVGLGVEKSEMQKACLLTVFAQTLHGPDESIRLTSEEKTWKTDMTMVANQ